MTSNSDLTWTWTSLPICAPFNFRHTSTEKLGIAMNVIPSNRMKSLLRAGTAVAGTMLVEFRQPSVMQVLKNAGYDFATIDMEHGVFDYESVADLSRFGRHIGITPLVRVPDKQYPYIARALDVGAQGIMVPRLRSAEDVREVVNIIKYPPTGRTRLFFWQGTYRFSWWTAD